VVGTLASGVMLLVWPADQSSITATRSAQGGRHCYSAMSPRRPRLGSVPIGSPADCIDGCIVRAFHTSLMLSSFRLDFTYDR
jgi:hypothetical protein